MNRVFILHYHEIWLKGGNKNYFLSRLRVCHQAECLLTCRSNRSAALQNASCLSLGTNPLRLPSWSVYAGFLVSLTLRWPAKFRVRLLNWVLRLAP